MEISNTNQLIINRNRQAIENQLQDIESQIAYIRRSFDPEHIDWMNDPELHMSHQANNMMVKVMELCALIATNKAIIKTSI
jgi:hypothetical protein